MQDLTTSTANTLTWADLCQAIDTGRVAVNCDGECYSVRVGDVVRWLRNAESPTTYLRRVS